ncbi:MAG: ATP-binding cassette domain-containing protein [Acidimicrobiia bacterium]|nr:ATP-binding cassette domain-containing protein [Acidimicrobiia bacterium]
MTAVHLRNLSFQYSSAVPVVVNASCSLGPGWTGLVGANGAGKTTLLRLIDGTLPATAGSVEIDPARGLVVRCPQTADDIDANVTSLAAAWDREANVLLGRLGLDRTDIDRWPTLSPGERKRWQIGGALYLQPDVLLLDEPTNHLDPEARSLLLDALDHFRGVGVVVSHDRAILNQLCLRVLRVNSGEVQLWHGNYDTAHVAWAAEEAAQLESYEKVSSERKKVERRLADKRRAAATKEAQHRRQLRTAGIKDKDARSMEKKGRFAGGQAQGSREMSLLRDEAERLRIAATAHDMKKKLGGSVFFDYEPARKARLLSYRGSLTAGGTTLVRSIDVVVERNDRIRLTGPNGAGKSTLLRALLAAATIDRDRVLYLPQELTREDTRALVESVATLDAATRGRVLGIVGLLGSDPKRLLATDLPSPGEARKLLIATGLGRGVWALLLDEPTNHLDLPSIERLEAALASYPGAMLVVTHDDFFARGTTETTWAIEDGRISVD